MIAVLDVLDQRPVVVALAGPNGAGKSTFYQSFLASAGLRYLCADDFASHLSIDAYEAAEVVRALRHELFAVGESFVFETVFSDPAAEKVDFLERVAAAGIATVLIYIGVESAEQSSERVSMRVAQGGHEVPEHKLRPRYERSLNNLERAIRTLPHVIAFDNSDLREPFRPVAQFEDGAATSVASPSPGWLMRVAADRLRG